MNWKIFTTAFVSSSIIFFPQNIIGCGPEIDPYDYYTSFFYQHISGSNTFQPFYYTGYNFLYDENDPVQSTDVLAKEWSAYTGAVANEKDARQFVTEYGYKDVNNLYYHLEKAQPLKIPDSVKRNSMTKFFQEKKDLEALGYILFAKQVQPNVTGEFNQWEPMKRDSVIMAKQIKGGLQLYAAAKQELFKLKYAYQLIRLAHYSGRYEEAIRFYDAYIPQNKTESVLQPMCLALKAGALYRTGKQKEAAYLFSKAFSENDVKRISNYLSFFWSVDSRDNVKEYTKLCKNNSEKAAMLSLFAMGNTGDQNAAIKEIYDLQPGLNMLEVLVTREVNKLEEVYLTPLLNEQKGGKEFYYTWSSPANDSAMKVNERRVIKLKDICLSAAKSGKTSNDGLFQTAAAYLSFMMRDYSGATSVLEDAKRMKLTPKVQDQWSLTNMLVAINRQEKIDAAFEAQILPSVKWLQQKALSDKPFKNGYYEQSQWKIFYRNLMSEIISKRYHAQGDLQKEVLAIGSADNIYREREYGYNQNALDYLRNNLVSGDVEKLYALLNSKNKTAFEDYLVRNNSLSMADVTDFAGTAFLRDRKYAEAIKWFNKSATAKKYEIDTDPFIELLYDREERFSFETKKTTKLAFAQEMLRLKKLAETDKVNAAKYLYKMALGLYNTTYYGHAWQLVQYYRSGSDGYFIPEGATGFQKEYYGCFTAHGYFKRAMQESNNAEFKAKCLFMMAKCDQKVLRQPQYSDFGYDKYDDYDAAAKKYYDNFRNNKYFPQFIKEYGNTKFYQEALTSCSYLRDFIKKN
ncbi:hypothetical protein [Ferruginibacter sp. HRS2-29]|uniref:hypothetical protein n=1 Tax=Ferruginibacter sp. HRS2-29 TaxID=2487334 RepID=UPI0020CB7B76|nr:hypothetical protein [Ferruginibacter sp. HRS2-29]MCP9751745.1 hypothetical protein [Ferruginibacter sp. HRS2-29]